MPYHSSKCLDLSPYRSRYGRFPVVQYAVLPPVCAAHLLNLSPYRSRYGQFSVLQYAVLPPVCAARHPSADVWILPTPALPWSSASHHDVSVLYIVKHKNQGVFVKQYAPWRQQSPKSYFSFKVKSRSQA